MSTAFATSLNRIHLLALATALFIAINSLWLNAFSTLDNRLSDFFVRRVALQLSPDPDIVIVDIDEASLAAMQDTAGSWPWPRAVHGELLQGIARQKPRAIVFDILFSEPDRYRPDSDQFFNEVLHNLHNVYFPMLQLEGKQTGGVPLSELARVTGIPHSPDADPNARAILLPPQAIATESWRVGLVNFTEDADGIARRLRTEDGRRCPSWAAGRRGGALERPGHRHEAQSGGEHGPSRPP